MGKRQVRNNYNIRYWASNGDMNKMVWEQEFFLLINQMEDNIISLLSQESKNIIKNIWEWLIFRSVVVNDYLRGMAVDIL